MESATILTPPSTSLSDILLFCQNPILVKAQNMKNYQHSINVRGEVLLRLTYWRILILRVLVKLFFILIGATVKGKNMLPIVAE